MQLGQRGFQSSLFIIPTTTITVSGHKMVLNVSSRMLWPSFSLYILVLRPHIWLYGQQNIMQSDLSPRVFRQNWKLCENILFLVKDRTMAASGREKSCVSFQCNGLLTIPTYYVLWLQKCISKVDF